MSRFISFLLLFVGSIYLSNTTAFHPSLSLSSSSFGCRYHRRKNNENLIPLTYKTTATTTSTTSLYALTPVGPFCPFRSTAALSMEDKMDELSAAGPEFATEFARIQLELQMGNTPDPDQLRKVADTLDDAVTQWETLMTRLSLSDDFQTREYAALTQTHLHSHNVTIEGTAALMRWQGACMRALANQQPPPFPPPGIDLETMVKQAQDPDQKKPPSITSMSAAEAITATPFTGTESAFQSTTVKDEYETLCRDHMNLIEMGSKYSTFDGLGKIYYLDEIQKISDRWDVFFTRFKLLGALNDKYVKQCDTFLASMGLNEGEYRTLLKQCHEKMRQDAEKERNMY